MSKLLALAVAAAAAPALAQTADAPDENEAGAAESNAPGDDADDGTAEKPEKTGIEQARELARQSLDHLESEAFAEALDKAQRAEELYHAPIHLKVIGQSLEGLSRLAEAADVYERLAAEPLPETAHPLFLEARAFARERLKELIARLPSLLVEVGGVDPDSAQATVDGKPFTLNTEVAVRFDPGSYELVIEAPDRRTVKQTIDLEEGAGVVKVTVTMRREGEEEEAVRIEQTGTPGAPMTVAGWVLVGVGGASLVAGGVTGGLALAGASDLESRCPDRRCTIADQSDYDTNVALGWTSTITLAVGGALVATGGLLLILDAGDEEEGMQALRLGPTGGSFTYRF